MSTFLVIGGTGKTGRRVVDRLSAAGHQVRAASRSSRTTPFDWADPGTHAAALGGVEGVYLTVPGQSSGNVRHVAELLQTAAAAGAKRAVLLSARAVEFHPAGALAAVERAVAGGPLEHTILRPSWFAQNFTEAFLAPDRDGTITAPTGDGMEPFIDLDDLADVATGALLGEGPGGAIPLSGSESLSFADAVAALAPRSGRPLRFVAADPDQYRARLAEQLPTPYVDWRMAMFDAIREGRDAYLSDGVHEVLGRPAAGFHEWVSGAPAGVPAAGQ